MRRSLLSFVMYKLRLIFSLFAFRTDLHSAAAEQQSDQKDQAARIYAQAKILKFSTAAAQEQDDEQDPSAVAATEHSATAAAVTAVAVAAAFAATVVKHTVEHFYLHFAEISAFVFD